METHFDYEHQAWLQNGRYIRCGHHEEHNCMCYGKRFEGLTPAQAQRCEKEGTMEREPLALYTGLDLQTGIRYYTVQTGHFLFNPLTRSEFIALAQRRPRIRLYIGYTLIRDDERTVQS